MANVLVIVWWMVGFCFACEERKRGKELACLAALLLASFLILIPCARQSATQSVSSKQAVRRTHAHDHLRGVESSLLRANGHGCGVGYCLWLMLGFSSG